MVCGFHAVGLQMTLVNHSWLVLRKWETSYLTGWAHIMWQEFPSNPYIPKIWLLILPSSCYTFPCILVLKIWFLIKETTFMSYVWIFLSPVCWIMYRYCWEKLYVNHIKKMYIIANHSWIVGRVLMTGTHHKREGTYSCRAKAKFQLNPFSGGVYTKYFYLLQFAQGTYLSRHGSANQNNWNLFNRV